MSHRVGSAVKRRRIKANKDDLLFYIGFMIFPIAQFCICYLWVNFNSLLLAFQKINEAQNTVTFTLFGNFQEAFRRMTSDLELKQAFGQSLLAWFVPLVIGTPLALLFSYYIYKKMPLSGAFRVMLFAPSIVSAIILATVFLFFTENAVPEILKLLTGKEEVKGLISDRNTQFGTLMFYNIWIGFGVNCLMYVNAMNDISPEQIEAANLDGCTGFKEFWHICMPSVFPTLSTFLVVGVAGIFTGQFNLFSFFGTGEQASGYVTTYGYWLYRETAKAQPAGRGQIPIVAAMGIMMTAVAVPLTLLVRWLLDKFGPSID